MSDPRGEFHRWRQPRPLLGSSVLALGGLMIGYVPVQFTSELMFIGGAFTIIGMMFAVLVVFCGIASLVRPELSSIFGVLGIALSTLSLFGALGGLFVGMIVGTIGGILCYAWEPPAECGYDETTLAEASEFIWQETGGFIWQGSSGFIWQTDGANGTDSKSGDGDADSVSDSDADLELDDRYKL
ncbi:DUF6114 domain-containing protein [Halorientalis brevis]|uniref:DUF6114 domain-containing protein n=1 Tax=Halorientalis brevis TaxID=1126241 RepID=A0ABD6CBT1_9EURY